MSRITNAFLEKLGINEGYMREWKPVRQCDLTEVTQLSLPLDEIRIL